MAFKDIFIALCVNIKVIGCLNRKMFVKGKLTCQTTTMPKYKHIYLNAVIEALLKTKVLTVRNGDGQLLERVLHLRLEDLFGLGNDRLNVLG